jgi:hypothetical protein
LWEMRNIWLKKETNWKY